jgi:hypothetical protein
MSHLLRYAVQQYNCTTEYINETFWHICQTGIFFATRFSSTIVLQNILLKPSGIYARPPKEHDPQTLTVRSAPATQCFMAKMKFGPSSENSPQWGQVSGFCYPELYFLFLFFSCFLENSKMATQRVQKARDWSASHAHRNGQRTRNRLCKAAFLDGSCQSSVVYSRRLLRWQYHFSNARSTIPLPHAFPWLDPVEGNEQTKREKKETNVQEIDI